MMIVSKKCICFFFGCVILTIVSIFAHFNSGVMVGSGGSFGCLGYLKGKKDSAEKE